MTNTSFADRHIGLSQSDIDTMLATLGFKSLQELAGAVEQGHQQRVVAAGRDRRVDAAQDLAQERVGLLVLRELDARAPGLAVGVSLGPPRAHGKRP